MLRVSSGTETGHSRDMVPYNPEYPGKCHSRSNFSCLFLNLLKWNTECYAQQMMALEDYVLFKYGCGGYPLTTETGLPYS